LKGNFASFISNNKAYYEDVMLGMIAALFFTFWCLKSIVLYGFISNSVNMMFWPIYGIAICVASIMTINLINDFSSSFRSDLPVYLLGYGVTMLATFILSFLFSKVFYAYHDLVYYRWTTVNILYLIVSGGGIIVTTFLLISTYIGRGFGSFIQDFKMDNICVVLIPYSLFSAIWGYSFYLDGIYFQKPLVPFILPSIHVILTSINGKSYTSGGYMNYNEEIVISCLSNIGFAFTWMVLGMILGVPLFFCLAPVDIFASIFIYRGVSDMN